MDTAQPLIPQERNNCLSRLSLVVSLAAGKTAGKWKERCVSHKTAGQRAVILGPSWTLKGSSVPLAPRACSWAHQLLSGHPLLLCVRRKQECPCSSLVVAPPESHHSSLWQFGLWALQFQISQRGRSLVSQSFPFKLSELGWGPPQEHGGGGDLSPDRISVDCWGSWGWNEASLRQVPGPPHAVSQISPPTKTAAGVPVFSQGNGRT